MAEDIYTKYNIDVSKLKRDYIKYPLQKIKINTPTGYTYEKPDKNDLYYLHVNCNLSLNELKNYFNCSIPSIKRWKKYFNIKKSRILTKNKINKTNLLKYGCENPSQNKEIREKVKQTNLLKYGCENPSQNKEIREKQNKTKLKKYGNEYFNNRTKCKQTCLKRYGYEYASQNKDIQDKSYQTKKKNHSFGISKPEKEIFNLLKSKYPNVIQQYKSEKYPFHCDFYIPSLDLYIEYQGYWTHGFEPYIDTKEQQEKVKLWKLKNTSHYYNAINIWTKRDIIKRETAKKNNLNWLEFFDMNQFMMWFNR